MKKVGIVGTNGIPANYGGLETLVENIAIHLDRKFTITVYCSKKNRKKFPDKINNIILKYSSLSANGWQSILYDVITTIHAMIKNDIVILMGPGVGFILILNYIFRKKIIVNHGGLDEWNREKYGWFEKKFLYYSTKATAYFSNVNIADNYVLSNSLKENFNVESVVIRYGGDYKYTSDLSYLKKYNEVMIMGKYFISVSRAQVDNNIHLVIDAFIGINENLVIVSNWSVSKYGRELYEKYHNKYSNIILLNAIYDKNELGYLREKSYAYIHSHSRCGTAPSLVEAMWQNKYPICFDVPTNRETSFNDSSYFSKSKELSEIVLGLSDIELQRYSKANFNKIDENYRWSKISDQYSEVIDE